MTPQLPSDRRRAKNLLHVYTGSADDFFKLWPPDKSYFFSSDNKSFLAYRVYNSVAISLGDPVGRQSSITQLLREYKTFCLSHHLRVIFIQTNSRYQTEYAANGLHRLMIGADAVIHLDTFMQTTLHNRYFRNILNRFVKQKYTFAISYPPHSPKTMEDVLSISSSWMKISHHKEWSFLTGRLATDYLQQVSLCLLYDSSGTPQAFVNQLPSFKPGVATIDLMRHRADAPPNSMDFLLISLMGHLHEQGYDTFNLGISPLDGQMHHSDYSARLLRRSYVLFNSFIGFRGLHQFKAKYQPVWEPRYVWYSGGVLSIPRYAIAIYKIMQHNTHTIT